MKKKYLHLIAALLVVVLSAGFTACGSDDDDDSGLRGWWLTAPQYVEVEGSKFNCCNALHFIDDNVVDRYFSIADKQKAWPWIGTLTPCPGLSGWYYTNEDGSSVRRYNYVIENNILYLYNSSNSERIDFFGGTPNGYSKAK